MQSIHAKVKTPFKYGVILADTTPIDCPSVFRHEGKWFLVYIRHDGTGYETCLAESDDLLAWRPLGKILARRRGTWDGTQAAGFVALQDTSWGGSLALEAFEGKYWLSYLGNDLPGYEPDPLSFSVAWTKHPGKAEAWTRAEKPLLGPGDADARVFERTTFYKSNIIRDPERRLGASFVVYYNGKDGKGVERIGMAVSDDMLHWKRHGTEPVLDHGSGITGDPQVVRIDGVWVMFYFGAFWKPKAFDRFACSYDLVHWTDWDGEDLVAPSEPYDQEYAHKPWVVLHEGVVYHYYCAVGNRGRCLALATSKDLRSPSRDGKAPLKDSPKPPDEAKTP
jgi:predicted GH43/DUF377 family glycosyl hydrolase